MPDHLEIKTLGPRRRAVIGLMREMGRPFTIAQLWKICSRMPNAISRATLYRLVRALRDEGTVKEIFLPHGQQILVYTDSPVICVVECLTCGLYADCPTLSAQLVPVIAQSEITPTQTVIFLRGPCQNINDCAQRSVGKSAVCSKVGSLGHSLRPHFGDPL
jgi:Fe2+ or Zn2+ uptake regulation protein